MNLRALIEPAEADEVAIRDLFAIAREMVATEDLAGWLALLTEDVYWGPLNQPALIGQEAVLGWADGLFNDFDITTRSTLGEIRTADGWGIVIGSYENLLVRKADGELYRYAGKFIYVVERGDDCRWRVARGIWNSNDNGAN